MDRAMHANMSHLRRLAPLALLCAGAAWWMVGCGGDASEDAGDGAARRPSDAQVSTALERARQTNPLARRVVAAEEPAPRPGPLPEGASCVTAECHTSYALANRIHQTLADGTCDSCHTADAGDHTYPLKRQGNELCTWCHQVSGTHEHQHPAIDEPPGCLNCHDPHAGAAKFRLTHDTIEQLCTSCHDLARGAYAHQPVDDGQCTSCHFPHQSQWRRLLRGGEGSAHCLRCHENVALELAVASTSHAPVVHDCNTCHAAHGSNHAGLLHAPLDETCLSCHDKVKQELASVRYPHGALDDERQCAACHVPHGSAFARLLPEREDRLCLSCHDRDIDSERRGRIADMRPVLDQPHLHGAVEAGDCSACHRGHGASVAALLKHEYPERFYAGFDVENYGLCFSCHSPDMALVERTTRLTGFRDGDRNLHYVHVHQDDKGRTCRACHAVHGSSRPAHIAEAVAFEGSDWLMPVRFEQNDHGGSCAPGCHGPESYSREAVPAETDHANGSEP